MDRLPNEILLAIFMAVHTCPSPPDDPNGCKEEERTRALYSMCLVSRKLSLLVEPALNYTICDLNLDQSRKTRLSSFLKKALRRPAMLKRVKTLCLHNWERVVSPGKEEAVALPSMSLEDIHLLRYALETIHIPIAMKSAILDEFSRSTFSTNLAVLLLLCTRVETLNFSLPTPCGAHISQSESVVYKVLEMAASASGQQPCHFLSHVRDVSLRRSYPEMKFRSSVLAPMLSLPTVETFDASDVEFGSSNEALCEVSNTSLKWLSIRDRDFNRDDLEMLINNFPGLEALYLTHVNLKSCEVATLLKRFSNLRTLSICFELDFHARNPWSRIDFPGVGSTLNRNAHFIRKLRLLISTRAAGTHVLDGRDNWVGPLKNMQSLRELSATYHHLFTFKHNKELEAVNKENSDHRRAFPLADMLPVSLKKLSLGWWRPEHGTERQVSEELGVFLADPRFKLLDDVSLSAYEYLDLNVIGKGNWQLSSLEDIDGYRIMQARLRRKRIA